MRRVRQYFTVASIFWSAYAVLVGVFIVWAYKVFT